jgi:hypothetical protein
MEARIIRTLVSLGVPGVALGMFYLLLRPFNFQFSPIERTWAAIIAILFASRGWNNLVRSLQVGPRQDGQQS